MHACRSATYQSCTHTGPTWLCFAQLVGQIAVNLFHYTQTSRTRGNTVYYEAHLANRIDFPASGVLKSVPAGHQTKHEPNGNNTKSYGTSKGKRCALCSLFCVAAVATIARGRRCQAIEDLRRAGLCMRPTLTVTPGPLQHSSHSSPCGHEACRLLDDMKWPCLRLPVQVAAAPPAPQPISQGARRAAQTQQHGTLQPRGTSRQHCLHRMRAERGSAAG